MKLIILLSLIITSVYAKAEEKKDVDYLILDSLISIDTLVVDSSIQITTIKKVIMKINEHTLKFNRMTFCINDSCITENIYIVKGQELNVKNWEKRIKSKHRGKTYSKLEKKLFIIAKDNAKRPERLKINKVKFSENDSLFMVTNSTSNCYHSGRTYFYIDKKTFKFIKETSSHGHSSSGRVKRCRELEKIRKICSEENTRNYEKQRCVRKRTKKYDKKIKGKK